MSYKLTLNKLLTIIFFFTIALPMFVTIVSGTKTVSKLEKRTLTKWIAYEEAGSFKNYFLNISDYVNDHFGLREDLININSKVALYFNESPVKSLIKGSNGWYFLKTTDPLISIKTNKKKIHDAINRRAKHVDKRHNDLLKKGIDYLYLVAPNKTSFYPEYLPDLYTLVDNSKTLNQFRDVLLSYDNAQRYYFDVQLALFANKKWHSDFDLYFKNDTHWNDLGAYIAYRAIVENTKKIYPGVEIEMQSHDFVTQESRFLGDLDRFLGRKSRSKMTIPKTTFRECASRSNIKTYKKEMYLIQCNTNDTTVLLIGDSFVTKLYPYVAESVGTLYVALQGISAQNLNQLVDEIKPDIVLEEIVQRDLAKQL